MLLPSMLSHRRRQFFFFRQLNLVIKLETCSHRRVLAKALVASMFYLTPSCSLTISAGGNEPRLVEAATKQLNKLPFYHSFWNRTTKPSLVLIVFFLFQFLCFLVCLGTVFLHFKVLLQWRVGKTLPLQMRGWGFEAFLLPKEQSCSSTIFTKEKSTGDC